MIRGWVVVMEALHVSPEAAAAKKIPITCPHQGVLKPTTMMVYP